MIPRRILWTAAASLLLLSLACSLPSISLPFGRSTPTPTPLPPLPPTLAESDPVPGEEFNPSGPLTLYFDQAMDRASVEAALSIEPSFDVQPDLDRRCHARAAPCHHRCRATPTIASRSPPPHDPPPASRWRDPVVLDLHTAAPLRVVQVVPDPDTTEVDPGIPITVVFSRPVVALQAEGGQPAPLTLNPAVEGTGEWLDTGIYVFRPASPLPGGMHLTATVAAGAAGPDRRSPRGSPTRGPSPRPCRRSPRPSRSTPVSRSRSMPRCASRSTRRWITPA